MYLIFDTSANGKPISWKVSYEDTFNWPRMVHISWILLGKDFKPLEDFNEFVAPDGFEINKDTYKRISVEKEEFIKKANPLPDILDAFEASLEKAQYIFTHNLKYNESILEAEYIRAERKRMLGRKEAYCLMEEGTHLCQIPGRRGAFKWPTLQQLHGRIFKKGYTPANNARADVVATARCFIAMRKVGLLDEIFDREVKEEE